MVVDVLQIFHSNLFPQPLCRTLLLVAVVDGGTEEEEAAKDLQVDTCAYFFIHNLYIIISPSLIAIFSTSSLYLYKFIVKTWWDGMLYRTRWNAERD